MRFHQQKLGFNHRKVGYSGYPVDGGNQGARAARGFIFQF